ncbi:hypothetical protein BC831DRAFT_148162 [Entophlyctis helioformis]|nr:hypothetical protein BC831DRAFT_148162 [Entophlyctis helioformis]
MLSNRLADPANAKFKSIRGRNPTFRTSVMDVAGAYDALVLIGIRRTIQDFEETFVVPGDSDSEIQTVQMALSVIEDVLERLKAKMDRTVESKQAQATASCAGAD